MSEQEFDELYSMWRFEMWEKGYGTYKKIDNDVAKGILIPFIDYRNKLSKEDNNG